MITLPNVLFTSAVIFAVAILMRSSIASFISGIVLIVGYLISQSLMSGLDNEIAGAMLDPFGLNALDQVTKYWTVSEKNTMMLPTTGVMIWNRALWIAVSIGIFVFGYLRFSFHDRKQRSKGVVEERIAPTQAPVALPVVVRDYSAASHWKQFSDQVRMDLKRIVTGAVFIIVMLLGLAQMITSLVLRDQHVRQRDLPGDLQRGGHAFRVACSSSSSSSSPTTPETLSGRIARRASTRSRMRCPRPRGCRSWAISSR